MAKTVCFGKRGLARFISWLINSSKQIREKYMNLPKKYKFDNLVLIAGDENKTQINTGVSNVYTFFHVYF